MGFALKDSGRRWPGPVVAYVIDPHFTDLPRVEEGIRHWEQNTNVRFVRRAAQSDFVVFLHSAGETCSSPSTGRGGGGQAILLPPGCSTPQVIHEIGHALGLIHEHQRPDRDNHVQVNLANVIDDRKFNFEVRPNQLMGPVYDTASIMHYSSGNFAKDPSQDTITPLAAGVVLDNSAGLTGQDSAFVSSDDMYPSVGIVRIGDSSDAGAGVVEGIAAVADGVARVVTAVRTAEGNLKLINWSISPFGAVARVGDSDDLAGEASSIALAFGRVVERFFVTALRSGGDDLVLISWRINDSGDFVRLDDTHGEAGEASIIRIVRIADDMFVTACRDGDGDLKLIAWRVVDQAGNFTRLGDSRNDAGGVSDISMVPLPMVGAGSRVATTVRTEEGTLKVIVWDVSPAGDFDRRGDSEDQAGSATLIESAVSQGNHLVTSCRTAQGNLVLISFSVSPDGNTVARLADTHGQAGTISDNALMARPYGVLSAVRAGNGNLKLIAWSVTPNGEMERLGDSTDDQAGNASLITLCPQSAGTVSPVITSVRTTASTFLKLITWDDMS